MQVNPLGKNPMSWKDAATIALILTLASLFTALLPTMGYHGILEDLGQATFTIFVYSGSQFLTNFIALSGLAKYTELKAKAAEKQKS